MMKIEDENDDDDETEEQEADFAQDTMVMPVETTDPPRPDVTPQNTFAPGVYFNILNLNENNSLFSGQGQIPLSVLFDEHCEELAFPSVWGGHPRTCSTNVKLSFEDHVNSEIRRSDRRAVGSAHLLFLHKKSQIKQLGSALNVSFRKKAIGMKLTATQALDKSVIESAIVKDNAYRFMANITGSPAYWENQKKNVLAMVRQLGIFSLFITLSAAETRWEELLKLLKKTVDKEENADVSELNHFEKARLIQKDPVTCALYFNYRFNELIKTWKNVENGPFGEHDILNMYYRIEFQHRGSPHVHMVVWLKNTPIFNSNEENTENEFKENEETEKEEPKKHNTREVEDFVDKIMTTSSDYPGMSEYVKYQNHRCRDTCKRKNTKCRFGAPFPPMAQTEILRPLDKQLLTDEKKKKSKEILQSLEVLLNKRPKVIEQEMKTFEEMLKKLNCSKYEYIEAIRSRLISQKIFLQRKPKDCRINQYSPKILSLMRSNMDIQFVLDPYACIGYIVDYINKSSRGLSKLLRACVKDFKNGNFTIRQQLKGLAQTFYNSTEISAQEAAWCRLRLPMSHASVACEFINTGPSDSRQRMLKSNAELLLLPPESEDIMKVGPIERYSKRPKELEKVCLAEYIAYYTFKGKKIVKTEDDENDDENNDENDDENVDENDKKHDDENDDKKVNILPRKIEMNIGTLTRRTVPKILRFVKYDIHKDRSNFFREQVMLYLPWRNEHENIESKDCEEIYSKNNKIIDSNRKKFTKTDINIFEILMEIEESRQNLEDEDDDVREKNEIAEDMRVLDYDEEERKPNIMFEIGDEAAKQPVVRTYTVPDQQTNDDFYKLCDTLNVKQRDYLMHIISQFKLKGKENLPVYDFISGGAGVGKTRLIKAMYQSILRIFRQEPGPVETMEIVLIAYTGKAAHNIGGMTAHNAFQLGHTQSKSSGDLTPDVLNTARVRYRSLQLVIIDEISMLGSKMFYGIHQRLCQIFGTKEPFGGISVIVVGDFNQLQPVADGYAFQPRNNPLANLVGSPLWDLFKFYELTEIMRQKDDKLFAEALGRVALCKMNNADLEMFKGRCFKSENDLPIEAQNAIHLFAVNSSVEIFNNFKIQKSRNEGSLWHIFEAVDIVTGTKKHNIIEKTLDYARAMATTKTQGLPQSIILQIGIRYMMTNNIDVSDGLFNGASGILRYIEVYKGKLQNIWIEFDDKSVGLNLRREKSHLQEVLKLNKAWTPISRVKRSFTPTYGKVIQVYREQYPVVVAEAITIHKSQGLSMETVVVGQERKKHTRQLLYVALSRATSLKGLFILGNFREPNPPNITDEVLNEMKRLRQEKAFETKFEKLRINNYDNETLLISHNVQSFLLHRQSIINDETYINSDIILMQETWTRTANEIDIPGFNVIAHNDFIGKRTARGTSISLNISNKNEITYIKCAKEEFGKNHIDLTTCVINEIKIINLYRNPTSNFELFKSAVLNNKELFEYENIIVCGDFNEDHTKTNQIARFLKTNYNMDMLSPLEPTTNYGTTIDIIFGKLPSFHFETSVYESYFSFHKPIVIRIKRKFINGVLQNNYTPKLTSQSSNVNAKNMFLYSLFGEERVKEAIKASITKNETMIKKEKEKFNFNPEIKVKIETKEPKLANAKKNNMPLVNPPLRKSRRNKLNYAIFQNTMNVSINNKSKYFDGLCSYNAIITGFLHLYKTNKHFQSYVKHHSAISEYFKFILIIASNYTFGAHNQAWGEYLHKYASHLVYKSEFPDINDVFKACIPDHISYNSEISCNLCKYTKESQRQSFQKSYNSNENSLGNIKDFILTNENRKCGKCPDGNLQTKIILSDLVVINIYVNGETQEQRNNFRVDFQDIQQSFIQDGKEYSLKFAIHHMPAHFVCVCRDYNNVIKICDLEPSETIYSNQSVFIYPALLIYYRNNT